MAALNLDTLWINARVDGVWSDFIELTSTSGLQQNPSVNMRVRDATGNRRIGTILPGGGEAWQVSSALGSWDEARWIRTHIGQLLCFRDPFGQKIFGAYDKPQFSPLTDQVHVAISFTVEAFTFDEAV